MALAVLIFSEGFYLNNHNFVLPVSSSTVGLRVWRFFGSNQLLWRRPNAKAEEQYWRNVWGREESSQSIFERWFSYARDVSKAITKQVGLQKFLAAPKMVSFSQLPTVEKDTISNAARKLVGPFYFLTTIEWWNTTKSISNIWQHFLCLLFEGIAEICMKYNSHNVFMRADQDRTSSFCQVGGVFCPILQVCTSKSCPEISISCIFLQSPQQVDMKNVVKCWNHSRNIPCIEIKGKDYSHNIGLPHQIFWHSVAPEKRLQYIPC